MKYFLLIICGFCFVRGYSQAVSPKYSNEFLSIGVGARALGMSGTQISNVGDVTAGYWNPSGLMEVEDKYQVSLMHAEYFAGIAKYDYAAVVMGTDSTSKLGFSIIRFAIDDIPDTRFLYNASGAIDYSNIRFFSAADYAFLFSYARRVNFLKGLKIGTNFKVIHRSVGEFASAWGFGLDAGAQLAINNWQFGLMIRDITGTFNAWKHDTDLIYDVYLQTGNEIPDNSIEITLPKMILGVSRYLPFSQKFGLLAALDLNFSFDGKRNVLIKSDLLSIDPNLGFEFDYIQTIYLRVGMGNIQEVKDFDASTSTSFQPNMGIGFNINNVIIDYALTDIGDQSESLYSHVFSLKFGLK